MTYTSPQARWLVLLRNILVFLLSIIVSSEIILRLSSYEDDSRIYIFGMYPVAIPPTLGIWEKRLAKLAEAEREALHYSTYDSLLGWAYRSNYTSQDSLYVFNEYGMRAHPEQLPDCRHELNGNCLRILLSGNSYMMSAEVPGNQSLAFYLEKKLWEMGVPCHIINGAAGNYSTDQAYLQWKYKAKPLKPDLVVLGINPRHFSGNTSIYPYCSFPETRIYYSKPRVIQTADSLTWVNLPTTPPNKLLSNIISDFENSPLYPYEQIIRMPIIREYNGFRPYIWSIWRRYMLFNSSPNTSNAQWPSLSQAIISKFYQEVSAGGGKMILLQTPVYEDILESKLGLHNKSNNYTYNVTGNDCYLETLPVFDNFPLVIEGFMPGLAHYSPEANSYLADLLADEIIRVLEVSLNE